MRDSDWSRQFLLRSDWLGLIVAIMTTKDVALTTNGKENLVSSMQEKKMAISQD